MNAIQYYANYIDPYYALTLIMFVISLIASSNISRKFRKYSKIGCMRDLSGAEVADRILRANGITDVRIMSIQGSLTDNYNPIRKTLNLSESVCYSTSISAVAVAAHECGHAIQHAEHYPLLEIRKSLAPICNYGSKMSYISILLGIIMSQSKMILLGAILFSAIVAFNLITLPVEINASKRALAEIQRLNLLTDTELKGGRKVLFAAGFTYFISLVSSIVQLLRLLDLARRRR